jgi:type VI secretion system protein VasI
MPDLGDWDVRESTNLLDGTRTVPAGLTSTDGTGTYGDPIELILRCMSGELDVFIFWDSYLGLDDTTITTRLGDISTINTARWNISHDQRSQFSRLCRQFYTRLDDCKVAISVRCPGDAVQRKRHYGCI